jgi:hypothetical protein
MVSTAGISDLVHGCAFEFSGCNENPRFGQKGHEFAPLPVREGYSYKGIIKNEVGQRPNLFSKQIVSILSEIAR